MWRLAALALIVCTGCAACEDTLLEDSFLGDFYTFFNPASPPPPLSSVPSNSPYFSDVTAQRPNLPAGKQ